MPRPEPTAPPAPRRRAARWLPALAGALALHWYTLQAWPGRPTPASVAEPAATRPQTIALQWRPVAAEVPAPPSAPAVKKAATTAIAHRHTAPQRQRLRPPTSAGATGPQAGTGTGTSTGTSPGADFAPRDTAPPPGSARRYAGAPGRTPVEAPRGSTVAPSAHDRGTTSVPAPWPTPARADPEAGAPVKAARSATAAPTSSPAAAAGAADATTPAPPAPDGIDHPPPVYRVDLPPARQGRWRLTSDGRVADARLTWSLDDAAYTLALRATPRQAATVPPARPEPQEPLIDWVARGRTAVHGLSPDRIEEHRRGRAARATNFQRDKGIVSWSATSSTAPLWTATQDRLSWLLQLAAVVRAGTPVHGEIVLAVADGRGSVVPWRFMAAGSTPEGWSHWHRAAIRPYDLNVDVWLDPVTHWPVRWQMQTVPEGRRLLFDQWMDTAAAADAIDSGDTGLPAGDNALGRRPDDAAGGD